MPSGLRIVDTGSSVIVQPPLENQEIASLPISCGVTAELATGLVVVVQSIISFMQRDDSFNEIGGTIAQRSVVVLH